MTWRHSVATAPDGTALAVHSTGAGTDVVLAGGALQAADDYHHLAERLAGAFTVHVFDRGAAEAADRTVRGTRSTRRSATSSPSSR